MPLTHASFIINLILKLRIICFSKRKLYLSAESYLRTLLYFLGFSLWVRGCFKAWSSVGSSSGSSRWQLAGTLFKGVSLKPSMRAATAPTPFLQGKLATIWKPHGLLRGGRANTDSVTRFSISIVRSSMEKKLHSTTAGEEMWLFVNPPLYFNTSLSRPFKAESWMDIS